MLTEKCDRCGFDHPIKTKKVEVDIVDLHRQIKKEVEGLTWFMQNMEKSWGMKRWKSLKRIDEIFQEIADSVGENK